ncbi:hypothetical protein AJ80_02620 [Polytolypa hystricis UAMH7299]|uniref:Transcription factor TFIIIC complex subunit Tfc6 n=1 Tax=Polytolypa hystricis (strain UAMH7299) TaxID=1447883 RepID=A0A2B7YRY3_POLH7|nr:hypothetical protein AJ80_02620 [Polytolypa hystricis UAMH7299]
MAPQARRSGRRHTRVSYTSDAFKQAGLEDELSGSERAQSPGVRDSQSSDEEYTGGADDVVEEVEAGAFEESGAESGGEEDLISALGTGIRPDKLERARRKAPGLAEIFDPNVTHSRGMFKPGSHGAKSTQLKLSFGASAQDLLPAVFIRDRWSKAVDLTFPSRQSLRRELDACFNDMGTAFAVEGDVLRKEASDAWDWYYDDDIGGKFRAKQQCIDLDKEAQRRYLPGKKSKKLTVLMGPASSQKAFQIGRGEFFDFGEAWSPGIREGKREQPKKKAKRSGKSGEPQETVHEEAGPNTCEGSSAQPQRNREGWILNMGNRVQCVSWAPNCTGSSQYLAVVVPISDSQKSKVESTGPASAAPAFSPSRPYPAAIQIWSFEASDNDSGLKRLDMLVKPRLRLAICTDVGDIKRMAWCPMKREERDDDENGEIINLGLLAGIWGDGTIKVIDVKINKKTEETQYVKLDSAAFEVRPPSSLCTCFCWLSPSDIAVGCANGYVGVWSLTASIQGEPQPLALPYLYVSVHDTYILSIVSSYPSHPHLLGTTGMDGQTRLFSLLDPESDIADAPRSRTGSAQLAYAPFMRSFVTADETDFIRLQPVRRFFSLISVAKSLSTVSAMTPGILCHPSLLVGNVGGTVTATNPLRRLYDAKEKHWQQDWFRHEWVPGKEDNDVDMDIDDDDSDAGNKAGVSKFYDGFKAETPRLFRNMVGDKRVVDGVLSTTIYEEGTATTALAWNPNKQCAGWACAGMGCGLLRVEDLAI